MRRLIALERQLGSAEPPATGRTNAKRTTRAGANTASEGETINPLYQALRREAAKLDLEVPRLWDFGQEFELLSAPHYWPEGFSKADVTQSCFAPESAFVDRMVRLLKVHLGSQPHAELQVLFVDSIATIGMIHVAYLSTRAASVELYCRIIMTHVRKLYEELTDAFITSIGERVGHLSDEALEKTKANTRLKLLTSTSLAEQLIAAQRDAEKAARKQNSNSQAGRGGGGGGAGVATDGGNYGYYQRKKYNDKRRKAQQQQGKN